MKRFFTLVGFICLMLIVVELTGCRNTPVKEKAPNSTASTEETLPTFSTSKEETLPTSTALNPTTVEDNFAQFEGSASEFEDGSSREETHEDTSVEFPGDSATSGTIPNVETSPAPTRAPDSQEESNNTSSHLPEKGSESDTNEGISGEWE